MNQPPPPSSPQLGGAELKQSQYDGFRDYLERTSGILLGDNKQYLVTSRLSRLMAEQGIADLTDLVRRMQSGSGRALRERVVDAMTTNETLWFRDQYPFTILRERLLPELTRAATGPVRIWSAACSSGQEPFSISMTVEEFRMANMGMLRQPVEIVATDVSKAMLDICRLAEYDPLSLSRGISPDRLKRYFERVEGDRYRLRAEVTQRVRFQQLNLLESFLGLGRFDIVFCRNVLIYFSAERKADILKRIRATLKPGGYLILGGSEGLSDSAGQFEMVQCNPGIIYRAR